MTTTSEPRGPRTDADVPVLADGVELLGEVPGSGYRSPPALVRRADGQTVQLTGLLYRVLSAVDGARGCPEIADEVSTAIGRRLTGAQVADLVDEKLRPLGLLAGVDGSQPQVEKANPLLALHLRWVLTDPRTTRRVTGPFARLFHPLLVVPLVTAFVLVCGWLLFDQGLGRAAHDAFAEPGLLLAVFGVTVLSAGFHEFGHAAAARYGGATPGAMGVGLYVLWPAFYTDVSDTYRLGRAGRIRTDLGGLYFNAVVAVAVFATWWATGWHALLLLIVTQLAQMIRQLLPLLRFDGYHLLADITGVPDLYRWIGPTLLPGRRGEAAALRPWARAVVRGWVAVVVPLMAALILLTVIALPRILATAGASIAHHTDAMADRFRDGAIAAGLVGLLEVVALAVPVAGISYLLAISVARLARRAWSVTADRPAHRAGALVSAALLAVVLVMAWWPRGNYHPIQPDDRGRLQDAVPAVLTGPLPAAAGAPDSAQPVQRTTPQTQWVSDSSVLPTADRPQLAVVMRPSDPAQRDTAPAWVFPFAAPDAPRPGDNQALAVNTTDGTIVYEVAFALVWVEDGAALNRNEAYALVSCQFCGAVAVSFQVVLVVGEAPVIVPQNIAAAVTYECLSCVALAIATQLIVTLPDEPTADQLAQLHAVWAEINALVTRIEDMSAAEIEAALDGYAQEITVIMAPSSSPSPSPTQLPGTTASTPPSDAPTTTAPSLTPSSSTPPGPTEAPSSATTSTTPDPQLSSP